MRKNSETTFTPTYNLTFRKLLSSWDRMAQEETLPTVIDRSYLRWLPGSAQTSYLALARNWGLTDEDNAPTELFRRLVYDPECREQEVNKALHEHYGQIIELGKDRTTAQQLMDKWKEIYGQDGDTRRKAITFFMHAAEFAGIQVSELWQHVAATSRQSPRASSSRRGSTRVPKQRSKPEPARSTPSHTIHFADGAGTLSVSVDVDLLKLTKQDREFVLGIVDAMREHKPSNVEASQTNEAEDEQPQR